MRMLLAIVLSGAVIGQTAQSQSTSDEDGALATVQTFVRGNETANLDLIMSTFAEGATVFNAVGDKPYRLTGTAQIRAAFEEVFGRLTSG